MPGKVSGSNISLHIGGAVESVQRRQGSFCVVVFILRGVKINSEPDHFRRRMLKQVVQQWFDLCGLILLPVERRQSNFICGGLLGYRDLIELLDSSVRIALSIK